MGAVIALPLWLIGHKPSYREFRRWITAERQKPASDTLFTILVADLAGDDNKRTETLRIARGLRQNGGLEVRLVGRTLETPTVGSLQSGDAMAVGVGREWLRQLNGDVLIWGQIVGKTLLLGFVSRGENVSGLKGYATLNERLELPRELVAELGVQIQAIALSLAAPATEDVGNHLVAQLTPVATKLRGLMNTSTPFPPSVRANLANSFGLAAMVLGEHTGDPAWIEQSLEAFQGAITARRREEAPYSWASLQLNLGNAFVAWTSVTGQDSLEQAVNAFRLASEAFGKEQALVEQAMAENNLAKLYWDISEEAGGQARLQDAVRILRSALTKLERDQAPLEWAAIQLNLGLALGSLGRLRGDGDLLHEAVRAYTLALEVFTPDEEPIKWSLVQSNLASTLVDLGEQQSNAAFLEEAVQRLRLTAQASSPDRVPFYWIMQHNLGSAISSLGEIRKSAAMLEEGVRHFQHIIQDTSIERTSELWAMTQDNLGLTLTSLGEITNDPARIEQAVTAFRLALQVYTRDQAPRRWAGTMNNLGRALNVLGILRHDPARIAEAVEAFGDAVEAFGEVGDDYAVTKSTENLNRARQELRKLRRGNANTRAGTAS